MSSSPGVLLSGVESISSSLSSEISAQFVFTPRFVCPFIHLNVISTTALSPGCNNVSANSSVVTVFPSSDNVQCSLLSSATNSNPSGI
jgi:hypothetical protein